MIHRACSNLEQNLQLGLKIVLGSPSNKASVFHLKNGSEVNLSRGPSQEVALRP